VVDVVWWGVVGSAGCGTVNGPRLSGYTPLSSPPLGLFFLPSSPLLLFFSFDAAFAFFAMRCFAMLFMLLLSAFPRLLPSRLHCRRFLMPSSPAVKMPFRYFFPATLP